MPHPGKKNREKEKKDAVKQKWGGGAPPPAPAPPPPPQTQLNPPPPPQTQLPPPPPPPQQQLPPPSSAAADNKPFITLEDSCLKIERLSLQVKGFDLLSNTSIELHNLGRYALVGPNGSLVLATIGNIIHPNITFCHVINAVTPSDTSVLDAVMGEDPQEERSALQQQISNTSSEDEKESLRKKLDQIGPVNRHRACVILAGFGFDSYMLLRKTRDFSEARRMRIALARALYVRPTILLLENPTKHLVGWKISCATCEIHNSLYQTQRAF